MCPVCTSNSATPHMEYVDGAFRDGGFTCDSCGTQYKVLTVEEGEAEAEAIEETAAEDDETEEATEDAPARGRRAKS